ncbi:protein suppressor 2 of zeste isoform X2 [Copidosoma floridanum]|uniref:protein suppressor 2 of zeste isoform X2 n=1 Tax=Copidosoma floridanum TaxID=29053 RepID=UPI0006C99061|nr:protein suppressor 2 of zeste isoform X2 [Copidosoma floridanum]
MSGQSGGQRLRLCMLNEHLTCRVCGGYFVDATTIMECLHTFCKSCIVKHLDRSKYCPVCGIQVHKSKPLLNIRPDQALQDIVYKLVPSCYQNEMRYRKEFYDKHPDERSKVTTSEAMGEPTETFIYSPDESLSLSLEYYSPQAVDKTFNDQEAASKILPRRYLRCPAAVTVFHLQKLIRAKYGLSEAHRVDIMYKEESLGATYTLMDIMYIYHWRRKVPLHLSYRIFESAIKQVMLSNDNDDFKQPLSNSNMEVDSKDDGQSVKREWKEVQLKISETGVMSVTDITSLDSKKSTKVNEINTQSVSVDQASLNSYNINTTVATEEAESFFRSAKVQQNSVPQKNEKLQEEKNSVALDSSNEAFHNNVKSEKMEVKPIDQRDLSIELLKSATESNKSLKTVLEDSAQESLDENQTQTQLLVQEQVKTESVFACIFEKQTLEKHLNPYNIIKTDSGEVKVDTNAKQNAKAGSKINALSAKLQFRPKTGKSTNTYTKKSASFIVKKRTLSPPVNHTEIKALKTTLKSDVKSSLLLKSSSNSQSLEPKVPPASSCAAIAPATHVQSGILNTSLAFEKAPSGVSTSANSYYHQQNKNISQPIAQGSEASISVGLPVSTSTMEIQASHNSWMPEPASSQKNLTDKAAIVDKQLRSLPGMPQIGKEILCSTTAASGSPTSVRRLSIQTPSMSIYYSSSSKHKPPTSKVNYDTTSMYSVSSGLDAAPISLTKSSLVASSRKDAVTKGTTVNEICDKIRSSSKLVTDNLKDKNKLEAQQCDKPEILELLKISKKNEALDATHAKHVPNIPNMPIYTPSNSQYQQMQQGTEPKDNVKKPVAAIAPSSQGLIMAAVHHQVHHEQQKQTADASNPASGVKPMYGVVSDQLKEKDQSSSIAKNSPTLTKIDPQTLSPIITGQNSMATPQPYSPTTRNSSYHNSPYQRNSGGSSVSSSLRNSPVNILSTSPFIPSHTPNTNPRIIYFPSAAGYSPDASHLSNPLIRPPIQPPPSAFHCSLPPSINKLYQRSGYLAQPQTSVVTAFNTAAATSAGFPATSSGSQRLQITSPNSHSSPMASIPSSASKLPKMLSTSSGTAVPSLAGMNLVTTSTASLADSIALQLTAKREHHNIFDIMRPESMKPPSADTNSSMSPVSTTHAVSPKVNICDVELKGTNANVSSTTMMKKKKSGATNFTDSPAKNAVSIVSTSTTPGAKDTVDKKNKNRTRVNGNISLPTPLLNVEKPKDPGVEAHTQQEQVTGASEDNRCILNGSNGKSMSSSPRKLTGDESALTQEESNEGQAKQANSTIQSKQKKSSTGPGTENPSSTPSNKGNNEARDKKAKS